MQSIYRHKRPKKHNKTAIQEHAKSQKATHGRQMRQEKAMILSLEARF